MPKVTQRQRRQFCFLLFFCIRWRKSNSCILRILTWHLGQGVGRFFEITVVLCVVFSSDVHGCCILWFALVLLLCISTRQSMAKVAQRHRRHFCFRLPFCIRWRKSNSCIMRIFTWHLGRTVGSLKLLWYCDVFLIFLIQVSTKVCTVFSCTCLLHVVVCISSYTVHLDQAVDGKSGATAQEAVLFPFVFLK